MKKWQGVGLLMLLSFLLLAYNIVGGMDLKQELQAEAWNESVQALEIKQEKIQLDILEAKEQLERFDEQLQAHNLLIWDIRERVHLDLELELEEGGL